METIGLAPFVMKRNIRQVDIIVLDENGGAIGQRHQASIDMSEAVNARRQYKKFLRNAGQDLL